MPLLQDEVGLGSVATLDTVMLRSGKVEVLRAEQRLRQDPAHAVKRRSKKREPKQARQTGLSHEFQSLLNHKRNTTIG